MEKIPKTPHKHQTTTLLQTHTSNKTDSGLWQCVNCLYRTNSVRSLVRHMWCHSDSTAIICDCCTLVTHINLWNIHSDVTGTVGYPNCMQTKGLKGCHCETCIKLLHLKGSDKNVETLITVQRCAKCPQEFTRGIELRARPGIFGIFVFIYCFIKFS